MKKYKPAVIAFVIGVIALGIFVHIWLDFRCIDPATGGQCHDPTNFGAAIMMLLGLVVGLISLLTALVTALIIGLRSRRTR